MTVALRGGNEGREDPRAVPDHLDIAKASRGQLCLGGFRAPRTLARGQGTGNQHSTRVQRVVEAAIQLLVETARPDHPRRPVRLRPLTRCVPDSPSHDALDRRVILREDTSESITCDEVVTSQTTQLTSQQ